MFKNLLVIAYRNVLKNRVYTTINILGLSLAISVSLYTFLIVNFELSFDSHHDNAERIYRVQLERFYGEGNSALWAGSPPAIFEPLVYDFPEVVTATRLAGGNGGVPIGVRTLRIGQEVTQVDNVFFADSTFFDIFSIIMLEGNPATALDDPNSVVITESTAKQYFKEKDPMGEIIEIDNWTLKVTGIVEDQPATTHFKFGFLTPLTDQKPGGLPLNVWTAGFFYHAYVLLNEGADPTQLESKFEDMVNRYVPAFFAEAGASFEAFQASGNGYKYHLQPLRDIHLNSNGREEFEAGGDLQTLYALSAIALAIVLISCINFITISTAKSISRAKEVGVRKTLGSGKRMLIGQFLSETLIITMVAALLSLLVLTYLVPTLNNFSERNIAVASLLSLEAIGFLLLFMLLISVVAGLYPASILSNLKPVSALKQKESNRRNKVSVQNGMVVFQFVASALLIASTLVIYLQMQHMKEYELGFQDDQLLVIKRTNAIPPNQIEAFKEQLRSHSSLSSASGITPELGQEPLRLAYQLEGKPDGDYSIASLFADFDLVQTLGVDIIEGRNLVASSADTTQSVIINQAAAKEFGWQSDPIGKTISAGGLNFQVVGVVSDFHFRPLHESIEPLIYRINNNFPFARVYVKVESTQVKEAIEHIEKIWKQFAAREPFIYSFVDQDFEQLYQAEENRMAFFSGFAIIAIFISSIGLFALATFLAETRAREIGIRKALGASVSQVVVLLSTDYLKYVAMAIVISIPLSWYLMNSWLEGFAYRVDIPWWLFPLMGVIVVITAFISIAQKTLAAAITKPVDSLKEE